MRSTFRRDRLVSVSLIVTSQLIFGFALAAQNVDRISKREVERRQAAVPSGVAALARAQAAIQAQNYAVAHDEFRRSFNSRPVPITSARPHYEPDGGASQDGVKVVEGNIADGRVMQAA